MTLTLADMAATAGRMARWTPAEPAVRPPKRRTFTAAYRARDPAGLRPAGEPGERVALLRREGLYTAHPAMAELARHGRGEGPEEKPAGRPARDAEAAEFGKLRTENEKLTAELARTKAALEVVGKAHALLELLSGSAETRSGRGNRHRGRRTRTFISA